MPGRIVTLGIGTPPRPDEGIGVRSGKGRAIACGRAGRGRQTLEHKAPLEIDDAIEMRRSGLAPHPKPAPVVDNASRGNAETCPHIP
jgi:hypothetical protein